MEIKIYPDPILLENCNDVVNIDEDLVSTAKEMIDTMKSVEGIGLAAPQVGILQRFFVCIDFSDENREESLVLINPQITKKEGRIESKEGCLSIPGFYEYVYRYENIEIKALDLDGKEVVYNPQGLQSVVFQHEYDHLDGILFPDRMSQIKKDIFMKKIKRELK
ncbi:peptide deformylase [bacterium]|nr:peptide deformylase [bacterium]MBT3795731.1 peptide deformylase [bacterium]MBT4633931.1 peptide deformylase [bacterium]